MKQAQHVLDIVTNGQGLVPVTEPVCRWVAEQRIATGLLTIWCRHTSASLLVQENAEADVRADLETFFRRLMPEGEVYRHDVEGPDDMPAHIKAALTQTQLSIPVDHGRPVLGTWQGIYLFEHRAARIDANWCYTPSARNATSSRLYQQRPRHPNIGRRETLSERTIHRGQIILHRPSAPLIPPQPRQPDRGAKLPAPRPLFPCQRQ
jgi:secondary thiamine-phosphate synthase enzyme